MYTEDLVQTHIGLNVCYSSFCEPIWDLLGGFSGPCFPSVHHPFCLLQSFLLFFGGVLQPLREGPNGDSTTIECLAVDFFSLSWCDVGAFYVNLTLVGHSYKFSATIAPVQVSGRTDCKWRILWLVAFRFLFP